MANIPLDDESNYPDGSEAFLLKKQASKHKGETPHYSVIDKRNLARQVHSNHFTNRAPKTDANS